MMPKLSVSRLARRITAYDPQAEMIGMRSELRRLREVETLAKELAGAVRRIVIVWDMSGGYRCTQCNVVQPGAITQDADGDLASLIHTDTCLITRARAAGLAEMEYE